MATSIEDGAKCPFDPNEDRRKTALLAAQNIDPQAGSFRVKSAAFARKVTRSKQAIQSLGNNTGSGKKYGAPEHAPVIFLDGEPHRHKRIATAKFLSPKTVTTQHRELMERTTDALLAKFRATGEARLEDMSFELASAVVSDILGLTNSDATGRSKRVERALRTGTAPAPKGRLAGRLHLLNMSFHTSMFFLFDVNPAKKARLKERKDDIISHLLDEGYSNPAILIECLVYGSAGMMTTREFIVMAAWYLFEQPELRERYLNSEPKEQLAILMEILRLEPVAGMLHKYVNEPMAVPEGEEQPAGQLYAIDIRAVNTDEALVGACPFAIDPDRHTRQHEDGRYFSFGDGPHNCPGWQVALHELRIFLDQLFRIPGLKLKHEPDVSWSAGVQGYELSNAIVTCDRAA